MPPKPSKEKPVVAKEELKEPVIVKPPVKSVKVAPNGVGTSQDHEERLCRIENKLGLDNWDI